MEYRKDTRVVTMMDKNQYERIVAYIDSVNKARPPGAKRLSVSGVMRKSVEFFLDSNSTNGVDRER